jgi:hypothetical protein
MDACPPSIPVERGSGRLIVWLGVAMAVAVAAVLFLFNPAEHAIYPRCFLKMTTGLECPGCGGLRATHQLLHGHIREAFVLNPLFVTALPFAAFFAARAGWEKLTGRKGRRFVRASTAVWIGAVIVVLFGVLRNLPWFRTGS